MQHNARGKSEVKHIYFNHHLQFHFYQKSTLKVNTGKLAN